MWGRELEDGSLDFDFVEVSRRTAKVFSQRRVVLHVHVHTYSHKHITIRITIRGQFLHGHKSNNNYNKINIGNQWSNAIYTLEMQC